VTSSPTQLEVEALREARAADAPMLDVVIPVHNEEVDLAPTVMRVRDHLARLPYTARVTIADNASTDGTALVAQRLAHSYDDVRVVHLAEKGRGRALKLVWSESASPVLVYMDVDLSTDLNALLPLVAPLISGHSDLAIGSRLSRGSRISRGPKRELISRCYNLLLRRTLKVGFTDAQCGFKAIRADAARELLPLVQDNSWFFDTELLVLAERAGLRIHEVPVDWTDDPDSRVDIVRTAVDDVRGIARLGWSLMRGRVPLGEVTARLGRTSEQGASGRLGPQVALFALIGVASTLAYALLYMVFRQFGHAQTANALALLTTAVGNTAANRRFTFGVKGRVDVAKHQVQGLLIFGAGLAVTSGSLWLLDAATSATNHLVEVAVLTVANLVVTVMRFVLMRAWLFRQPPEYGGQRGREHDQELVLANATVV
jgi:putative flippase GtrA